MITPAWVCMMAAYNAEMNRRLYAAAETLTDDERRAERGAFFGSIHGTLSHLVWGDTFWMSRFTGSAAPSGGIADSVGRDRHWDALKQDRAALDAQIESWAATLDAAWLDGSLGWFSGSMKRDITRPRAALVTHFFNHQTHHRGQAHALLTGFGAETGATDLPFILPFD